MSSLPSPAATGFSVVFLGVPPSSKTWMFNDQSQGLERLLFSQGKPACMLPTTVIAWPSRALGTKLIRSVTTDLLLHLFSLICYGTNRQYLKLTEKLLLYWGVKSLCTQVHCPHTSPFRCDLDSNHWDFEVCGSRAHVDMVRKVTWLFLCESFQSARRAGNPWSSLPDATSQRSGWHLADSFCVTSVGGDCPWREAAVYGGHWGPGNEAAWMCRRQQL